MLYDCYNSFYNLGNMVLAIAGNVNIDDVTEVIESSVKTDGGEKIKRKNKELCSRTAAKLLTSKGCQSVAQASALCGFIAVLQADSAVENALFSG